MRYRSIHQGGTLRIAACEAAFVLAVAGAATLAVAGAPIWAAIGPSLDQAVATITAAFQ